MKSKYKYSKHFSSKKPKTTSSEVNSDNELVETEDNRVIDDINKGKLSTAPLHTNFDRLSWRKDDKDKASQMGLSIMNGRFTTEEDIILTKNWHQFCDDFPVDNPHMVLGYYGYNLDTDSLERKAAKYMVKRSQMYLRLAKGLPNRTIVMVYQRARKLFSGLNKSQNLTEEDRKQIIELSQRGYKGREIAHKIFADIKTVDEVLRRNVNRNNKRIFDKNKWTEEEDNKFKEIIRGIIHKIREEMNETEDFEDRELYKKIFWSDVALLMGNRNEHQCREHFDVIKFSMVYNPEQPLRAWNKRDSQRLVYFLYHKNYRHESDIDWDEIKDKFSDHRYSKITRSWWRIKNKINNWQDLKFPELIKRLFDEYVENNGNFEDLEAFIRYEYIA